MGDTVRFLPFHPVPTQRLWRPPRVYRALLSPLLVGLYGEGRGVVSCWVTASLGYHLLSSFFVLMLTLCPLWPVGVPLGPLFSWPVTSLNDILVFCQGKIFLLYLLLARPKSNEENSPGIVFLAPSRGELHTHTHTHSICVDSHLSASLPGIHMDPPPFQSSPAGSTPALASIPNNKKLHSVIHSVVIYSFGSLKHIRCFRNR